MKYSHSQTSCVCTQCNTEREQLHSMLVFLEHSARFIAILHIFFSTINMYAILYIVYICTHVCMCLHFCMRSQQFYLSGCQVHMRSCGMHGVISFGSLLACCLLSACEWGTKHICFKERDSHVWPSVYYTLRIITIRRTLLCGAFARIYRAGMHMRNNNNKTKKNTKYSGSKRNASGSTVFRCSVVATVIKSIDSCWWPPPTFVWFRMPATMHTHTYTSTTTIMWSCAGVRVHRDKTAHLCIQIPMTQGVQRMLGQAIVLPPLGHSVITPNEHRNVCSQPYFVYTLIVYRICGQGATDIRRTYVFIHFLTQLRRRRQRASCSCVVVVVMRLYVR